MPVPAVTTEADGLLSYISVEVTRGNGSVWVNIQPFVGIATQRSARLAARIAGDLAGVDLRNYNFYFEIESTAESVDGPSAGAAFTLLAYSALKNRQIRRDFTLTGTIVEGGGIGQIGGVKEKITAAGKSGMKVFALPRGQSVVGGEGLKTMAKEEWGMQIVEVSRIQEVINIAFTKEGTLIEVNETVLPPLVLPHIDVTDEVSLFKRITEKELNEAKRLFTEIKERYKDNEEIMEVLYEWKKDINESEYLLKNNYLYSAANTAFIVMTGLKTILNSNMTKLEVEKYINNLAEKIEENFTPPRMTKENFEWVVGGEQRRIWAIKKIREVKNQITGVYDPIMVLREAMYAESWYEASLDLFKIAEEIGGSPVSEEGLKLTAELIINETGDLLNISDDVDGIWKLEAALEEFNRSMYIAAIFDARYAKAVFSYEKYTAGKNITEIENLIDRTFLGSGLWSPLYADHAIYLLENAKRYEDRSYMVSAFKIHYFSTLLEISKQDVSKLLEPKKIAPSTPTVEVSYEVERSDNLRTILVIAITAIIVLLVFVVILLSKRRVVRKTVEKKRVRKRTKKKST